MRRRGGTRLALFCALLFLAACGGSDLTVEPAARPGPAIDLAGVLPTPTPAPPVLVGEPQPGGTWTRALSQDPVLLNPILAADSASQAVTRMIFPALVRPNPITGQYSAEGAVAERWEVSPDGRTWTFYLRPAITWSDGDPVDATDFKFTYDAIRTPALDSPYQRLAAPIESIEIVNPLTARVTLREPRCDVLNRLYVGWMPSHRYAPDFSDVLGNFFNVEPDISAGPFLLQSWIPGENVELRRNSRYWQGVPFMDRMLFRIVPDPDERLNLLRSGELDEALLEPDQLVNLLDAPAVKVASAPVDAYDFIAINLANPEAPQRGLNESGAFVSQDPHPQLADRIVRQAMAHAIDYPGIVAASYLGQAYPLPANVLPIIPWAYDTTLEPATYNPDLSRSLLQQDGWIDSNRDGIREKDIRSLRLTLIVPESNPYYQRIAETVQDQLNAVGFDITVSVLSDRAYASRLLGQSFDLALGGWSGIGVDPDDHELWQAATDRPGSGFNFISYQNPRIETLLQQGTRGPSCDPQMRAPVYREIQQILQNDMPYLFLAGIVRNIGYTNAWGGIEPGLWDFYHNVHEWYSLR